MRLRSKEPVNKYGSIFLAHHVQAIKVRNAMWLGPLFIVLHLFGFHFKRMPRNPGHAVDIYGEARYPSGVAYEVRKVVHADESSVFDTYKCYRGQLEYPAKQFCEISRQLIPIHATDFETLHPGELEQ
jgi:hypothetical protein